MTASIAGL